MDGGDAVGAGRGEELVSRLPGTPHYNSAILEDMCMKDHLAALHGICGDSEAFRDAVILGKVRFQFFQRSDNFRLFRCFRYFEYHVRPSLAALHGICGDLEAFRDATTVPGKVCYDN